MRRIAMLLSVALMGLATACEVAVDTAEAKANRVICGVIETVQIDTMNFSQVDQKVELHTVRFSDGRLVRVLEVPQIPLIKGQSYIMPLSARRQATSDKKVFYNLEGQVRKVASCDSIPAPKPDSSKK